MNADAPVSRVGVVGVGRMGLPMARRAAAAGFAVTVFDTDPARQSAAAAAGLGVAASLGDLAATAELALVVVPSDEDVLSVCQAPDGLTAMLAPGALLAVCSSVRPETVRAVGEAAAGRGLRPLDLPLVKGIRAAEAGTMTVLAGGAAVDLERARPLLMSFATRVHHLGPVGAAQATKTVNNLLLWANLAAAAEALAFGAAQGLEVGRLRAALADCSADSWVLRELDQIQPVWPRKDLLNALVVAEAAGCALPLTEKVTEVIGKLDRAALDRLLAQTSKSTRQDS